jgi:hypothetical protein
MKWGLITYRAAQNIYTGTRAVTPGVGLYQKRAPGRCLAHRCLASVPASGGRLAAGRPSGKVFPAE